jgi:hypothetical protein
MTKLNRDVEDLGFSFTIECPDDWREFELAGSMLTLAGHLGEPEGSLVPTVQVRITPAKDAVSGFGELRAGLVALPEVALIGESANVEARPPYYTLGAAYVNPDTSATEVQTLLSIFSAAPPCLVTAVGICGGGAPEDVVTRLLTIVQTLRISAKA